MDCSIFTNFLQTAFLHRCQPNALMGLLSCGAAATTKSNRDAVVWSIEPLTLAVFCTVWCLLWFIACFPLRSLILLLFLSKLFFSEVKGKTVHFVRLFDLLHNNIPVVVCLRPGCSPQPFPFVQNASLLINQTFFWLSISNPESVCFDSAWP